MEDALYGKYEYHINSYLANCKHRASLAGLFLLLQESALQHAEDNGFGWEAMSKKECFWVLARIKVCIEKYPAWQDTVFIETWSKEPDALMAYRDFEMFSPEREKILSASSGWLMINKERRLQRMTSMRNEFPILDRVAINGVPGKLPEHNPDKVKKCQPKTVTYSEIDLNGHVNNTLYLQWVIDEFPYEYLFENDVYEADINYLQETTIGQQYYVIVEERITDQFLCSVIRNSDDKILAKMELKFRAK